jgi:hypothetical protein
MSEPVNLHGLEHTRLGVSLLMGRLVVTMRSKTTGEHIGLDFKCWAPGRRTPPLAECTRVYVNVAHSWDKVATINPHTGTLYPDKHADPCRLWTLRKVLEIARGEASPDTVQYEVLKSEVCTACGYPNLTDPDSIEMMMGPDCAGRMARFMHQHKIKTSLPPGKAGEGATESPVDPAVASPAEPAAPSSLPGMARLEPGEPLDKLFERLMQS